MENNQKQYNGISRYYGKRYQDKIIVFIMKSSWGEADAFLPLLSFYKEKKYNIITIVTRETLMGKKKYNNLYVYNILCSIADVIIDPYCETSFYYFRYRIKRILYTRIRSLVKYFGVLIPRMPPFRCSYGERIIDNLIKTIIEPEGVEFIYKDNSAANDYIIKSIEDRCRKAKIIIHPHSTMPMIYQSGFTNLEDNSIKSNDIKVDYQIIGNEIEADWHKKRFPMSRIIDVGFPRYDSYWINKFIDKEYLERTKEYEIANRYSKVFTYFARHPHYLYLPDDEFEYLVEGVGSAVDYFDNSFLFVKAHPRMEADYIRMMKHLLDKSLKGRYFFSYLPPLLLSYLADFIISVYSSAMSDALAIKKPVVEFYQFTGPDQTAFVQLQDGTIGSSYNYLNLVPSVKTTEELIVLIEDYFLKNGESEIWKNQKINSQKYLNLNEDILYKISKIFEI